MTNDTRPRFTFHYLQTDGTRIALCAECAHAPAVPALQVGARVLFGDRSTPCHTHHTTEKSTT